MKNKKCSFCNSEESEKNSILVGGDNDNSTICFNCITTNYIFYRKL